MSPIREALLSLPGGPQLRDRCARSAVLVLLRHALGGTYPWSLCLRAIPRLAGFAMPSKDDADIFHRVVVADEYGVSHLSLAPDDVVVDVGAHVGSFVVASHQLGCRRIVAYEASPRFFPILRKNVRRLHGVETVRAAVCGGDTADDGGALISRKGAGGDTVLFGGRRFHYPTQRLSGRDDHAATDRCPLLGIDRVLARFPRVRLLKLDCEGSEFPILLTSRLLDRVELIVGEYHEISATLYPLLAAHARIEGTVRYNVERLAEELTGQGFRVAILPVEPNMGLFAAWRAEPVRS